MKKKIVLSSLVSLVVAVSAWAGFGFHFGGHIGHFPGHIGMAPFPAPVPIAIHHPGFFPGHPGIGYHDEYHGPRFNPWHDGYVRFHPFPAWYVGHDSCHYDFRWHDLKEVTCTAQDAGGRHFYYRQSWRNDFNEQEIQKAENEALEECYRANGGGESCFLAGCSPVYHD